MSKPYILIVFVSETGSTQNLAHSIARGVNSVSGIEAKIRTVAPVHSKPQSEPKQADQAIAFASSEELKHCAGLAIGSPTHFGNMASALQFWLEGTTSLWFSGALVNKPVCAFTSSSSLHGGQETTLINILTPLLHHGMMVLGVPYTVDALSKTEKGGTPYGASHVAGGHDSDGLTDHEHSIAIEQGKRLARIALAVEPAISNE